MAVKEPVRKQRLDTPVDHHGRRGFLPIETNWFDRVFISVVIFIGGGLLWMRFLEWVLPLWLWAVIAVALAVYIIRKG